MKNILVLAHDDPGQEARLQAALDVARAVGGHLTCIDVTPIPVMMGDFESATVGAMVMADARVVEADNRQRTEARLANDDVPWTWIDATGDISGSIERASSLADLIVVNNRLDSGIGPDMREVAGRTAVRTDRPVLAVPQDRTGLNLRGSVLVAWDGSHAADAALRAAVPLLKFAQKVTLFEIDDGSLGALAEEAAAYLSRHGIHPVVKREKARLMRASSIILSEIAVGRYSYVVIGSYGRGRMTESLFGGVTRALLTGSRVPVFMAR
jgi:nucleotide-binding universal stress UspA family protein